MLIFLLIYIVVIIWGVKVKTKPSSAYLDMEHTQAVKGIFILLVFFSHFNAQVSFTLPMDKKYGEIISFFGQTMVTMFLFYSGYGIMESIKSKGKPYIDGIPKNRLLPTLIRFDCAVIIYAVISLVLGQRFSPLFYILSLTGWESVGNSNWYIFDILVLYLLTYVVFKAVYSKRKGAALVAAGIMLVLVCLGIVFLTRYYIKPTWWYDTVLCYMVGIFYSLAKPQIEKVVNRNWITWLLFLIGAWGIFAFLKLHQINVWLIMARNIWFCIAVTILTMRIQFKNKILVWCGKHLFEIYILQRIPMMLLKAARVDQVNVYVYFAGCVVITAALILPFKYVADYAVKILGLSGKSQRKA